MGNNHCEIYQDRWCPALMEERAAAYRKVFEVMQDRKLSGMDALWHIVREEYNMAHSIQHSIGPGTSTDFRPLMDGLRALRKEIAAAREAQNENGETLLHRERAGE